MADLIDGYCRLVNGATQSFIIRPQKGKDTSELLPAHPAFNTRQRKQKNPHWEALFFQGGAMRNADSKLSLHQKLLSG